MESVARVLAKTFSNSGIVWKALGAAMLAQGKTDLDVLQRAASLLPADAEALNNLGNALREHGRPNEASNTYIRALVLHPGLADAYCGLGLCSSEREEFDIALTNYKRALSINPTYGMAHNNMGNAQLDGGQFDEAMASYCRALEIAPDFFMAHNNLGNALWKVGRLQESLVKYQRAIELKPNFAEAYTNLLMALQFVPTIGRDEMFAAHLKFGQQFEPALMGRRQGHSKNRDPNRRIKIGYVSGDFRTHAVAYFIEPVLAHHDRSQVEIFCYANSAKRDAVTERLMATADHWITCMSMSDDVLAQRIRDDGIDILVDLSGHTANNRLLVFARKPAPIQVTYLGYPNTSGLSAMDYRLTDQYTEPEGGGADQYYTEKLVRLPDSVWCYRPPDDMPVVNSLPALTNGYLTFGSFNNVNKVGRESIALWAKLLCAIPSSRLLIATVPDGDIRVRLLQEFAEHGVSGERIEMCGKLNVTDFLHKMQEVDIALDPILVNGATTTCESIWLGIPTLTLVGDRFLSRAGLSVLSAATMSEFAAMSQDAYLSMATSLASDIPGLAALRAGMRERLKTSPLLDQQRFTRDLEDIYRRMWNAYTST